MSLTDFQEIRDFLLLHYKATERDDTPFWRHGQALPLTDSLKERWELYEREAQLICWPGELFKESSWFAVFTGQGVRPRRYHPFADLISDEELDRRLTLIKGDVQKRVDSFPAHDDFVRRHCAADALPASAA
jgi:tryptophan halogenase